MATNNPYGGWALPPYMNPLLLAGGQGGSSGTTPTPPSTVSGTAPTAPAPPSSAPSGVDPGWWEAYKREHGGKDPTQTGEGVEQALWNKTASQAWAQQHGNTPFPWQATYGSRANAYYSGASPYQWAGNAYGGGGGWGGGGGGYYSGGDTSGIPEQYRTGFANVYGKNWYETNGGDAQMRSDYQTTSNAFGNYANRWPTPTEWTPFFSGLAAWGKTLGRPLTVADMANYADVTMRRIPTAPSVSYLKTGEL